MRFESYFKIIGKEGEQISLREAFVIAEDKLPSLYDPEGRGDSSSWSHCYNTLYQLKDCNLIKDYKVLRSGEATIEQDEDKIY